MNLIVLNSTSKSIEFRISGSVASQPLEWTSHYAEVNLVSGTFIEKSLDGLVSGTNSATIVPTPGASNIQHIIREIVIFNPDTSAQQLHIRYNSGGLYRTLAKEAIASGARWALTEQNTTLAQGVVDGDKGDITVSGGVWSVDPQAITYGKIQNVTNNRLLGRSTGTAGSPHEIYVGAGLSLSTGTLYFTGSVSSGGDALMGSIGLIGQNNSGTPNTQYDFSANLVSLRNPSTGAVVVQIATGTVTNNVSTAGSTANGRDQAGAFTASSWIHFYWIWNGATLATLSSASAPQTGPTLPSGYTHWAYIGAIYFNGSSQLVSTWIKGNRVYYKSYQRPLSAGTATTETAVSLTAYVPPNAQEVSFFTFGSYSDATAAVSISVILRLVSGSDLVGYSVYSQVSNIPFWFFATMPLPNIGQNIYYYWSANTGTRSFFIDILGYSVPNGSS